MPDRSLLIDPVSDSKIERLFLGAKLEPTIIDSRVAHIYEHCLVAMLFDYLRREYRTGFPVSSSAMEPLPFSAISCFSLLLGTSKLWVRFGSSFGRVVLCLSRRCWSSVDVVSKPKWV